VLRRTLLLALGAPWWWAEALALEDPFRTRALRDQAGRETSLALQAAGEALVVVVMKGHWCQVCIGQLQRFQQLRQRFDSLEATVVGLNADAPELNRRMAEREGIEQPVLSDEQHRVLDELGLWLPRQSHPMPGIVVFDRCGDEAARWVGRRPGERPESAVLAVLRKLAEDKRVCDRPSA